MSSHAECRHPATKQARSICRQYCALIEYAQELGLSVKPSDDQYARQCRIKKSDDDVYGTYLILTAGDHRLLITRSSVFSEPEDVPNKRAKIWLEIIAI